VTGEWRKVHNEELHHLYYSQTIVIDKIEYNMGGACSAYRVEERRVQGFGGKT
jgi:hypothetical protein